VIGDVISLVIRQDYGTKLEILEIQNEENRYGCDEK
jgi:hypothetical protein